MRNRFWESLARSQLRTRKAIGVAGLLVVVAVGLVQRRVRMEFALWRAHSYSYSLGEDEVDQFLAEMRLNMKRLAKFGPEVVDRIVPWLDDLSDPHSFVAHGVLAALGERAIPPMCRLALSDDTSLSAKQSLLIQLLLQFPEHPLVRETIAAMENSTDPDVRGLVRDAVRSDLMMR